MKKHPRAEACYFKDGCVRAPLDAMCEACKRAAMVEPINVEQDSAYPGILRGMFWVHERTYADAAEALAQRLEATAAMLRRGRKQMCKKELYEKLVFLCEQTDWSKSDTGARFTITDIAKEIGTVEADLIVAAFEGRFLSGEALRKAHRVLSLALEQSDEREMKLANEVKF